MKNKILVGVAIASFSLSAFAQNTKNVSSVTIQYPSSQGGTYSPQPGVSIQFSNGNKNSETYNPSQSKAEKTANANAGMGMGSGNGVGNAPDLSEYQAQSMATAQALNNQPIDLTNAPPGAEEVLKNGSQAININNPNQINEVSKQKNENTLNNSLATTSATASANSVLYIKPEQPKSGVVVTDISDWNQGTIKQFEKEGKERTEQRYKEFLSK